MKAFYTFVTAYISMTVQRLVFWEKTKKITIPNVVIKSKHENELCL